MARGVEMLVAISTGPQSWMRPLRTGRSSVFRLPMNEALNSVVGLS